MAPIANSKALYLCPTAKGLSLLAAQAHLRHKVRPKETARGEGISFVGRDADGVSVYVGAYGRWRSVAMRAVTGLCGICSGAQPLVVCDVLAYLPASPLGNVLRIVVTMGLEGLIPFFRKLVKETVESAARDTRSKIAHYTAGVTSEPREAIIFHCYGSAHTSVVQAALYLGLLSRDRPPLTEELNRIPHFDKVIKSDIGTPMFMGNDKRGRPVYVLGFGSGKGPLKRLLQEIIALLGIPQGNIRFFDSLSTAGFLTRLGGFLSRGIGLVWPGRPIVNYAIRRDWSRVCALSERISERLEAQDGGESDKRRNNPACLCGKPRGEDRPSSG
ncbi:MAG TPA: DUF3189 family protein [Firmicutes bacterium]|nr:DUF3189 family protein [Bacillota bacterium]